MRNFDTLIRHFTQTFCLVFDLAPISGWVEFIAKKESAFSIFNMELICIALCCSVKFNTLLLWIKECIIQVHKEMHIIYSILQKKHITKARSLHCLTLPPSASKRAYCIKHCAYRDAQVIYSILQRAYMLFNIRI